MKNTFKSELINKAVKFCLMTKDQAKVEYNTSPSHLKQLIKIEKRKWLKTINNNGNIND